MGDRLTYRTADQISLRTRGHGLDCRWAATKNCAASGSGGNEFTLPPFSAPKNILTGSSAFRLQKIVAKLSSSKKVFLIRTAVYLSYVTRYDGLDLSLFFVPGGIPRGKVGLHSVFALL